MTSLIVSNDFRKFIYYIAVSRFPFVMVQFRIQLIYDILKSLEYIALL